MSNKINRFCDGLIEAAWLAAVIIAPLFFNIYSARSFEPDKIAILRSLALLILAAWIVKLVNQVEAKYQLSRIGQSQRLLDRLVRSNSQILIDFVNIPLILPVIFLAGVYLITTVFSVTPAISLWGSYQRLQGTYTTFSYLVVFAALIGNLHRRSQVERLFSIMILTSLPVTFYGILQHYNLDPIPWGGEVSKRIAANLGNSIFLAAYLVMVFLLTLSRLLDSVCSFREAGKHLGQQVVRISIYAGVVILQVTAIYMSGSRGPVLGWLAACFVVALLMALWWRKRWLIYSLIAAAFFLSIFLLGLNQKNGPLEALRTSPVAGRFGMLLDPESKTALVRRYIWEGTARLVAPHPPLQYPDGSEDRWNNLRPLLGYGPESMFVVFNPFYNPAIGQLENRVATPDRSHNEIWDSLVTSGILGLVATMWLFSGLFYYGLKWMGLMRLSGCDDFASRKGLFWLFYVTGGIAGGICFILWRGIEYLGVGISFGILLGLIGYVILTALQESRQSPETRQHSPDETARFITLLGLFSAILAHFVEINFGIAIAVTRTYFWVYAALLILVGMLLPKKGEYHELIEAKPNSLSQRRILPDWAFEACFNSGLLAILLITLGYDFITNQQAAKNPLTIIWNSFTQLSSEVISVGILALCATTWLVGSILFTLEAAPRSKLKPYRESVTCRSRPKTWSTFIILAGVTLVLAAVLWLLHSWQLAMIARVTSTSIEELITQVERYTSVFSIYLIFLAGLLVLMAFFAPESRQPSMGTNRQRKAPVGAMLVAGSAILLVGVLITRSNLRIIQADITFKLAQTFDQPNSYPVAIEIYQKANRLAPMEDYYYLALGRVYLDYARTLQGIPDQEQLFTQIVRDLKIAQALNPLNTDHTANLARLYSLWATYIQDPTISEEKLDLSDRYYSSSIALSPKNVRLWNEWAYLGLRMRQAPDVIRERLERAMQVDPSYDWTYGQLGDLYAWQAEQTSGSDEKRCFYEQAVAYYRQSQALSGEPQVKYNVNLGLGETLVQLERISEAIVEYKTALQTRPSSPSNWKILETLARLYSQVGDQGNAYQYAVNALNAAKQTATPESQARLKALIEYIQSSSTP